MLTAMWPPDPVKHCQTCRCRMRRHRKPSGRLEGIAEFRRKRFCSNACWYKWRGAGHDDFEVTPAMRAYLQAFDEYLKHGTLTDRQRMTALLQLLRPTP